MGYSIGIRARTPILQKRMLEFMKAYYRNWPTVEGRPDGAAYAGEPTNDMSYDHAKRAIGVDYGAVGGWERVYAYTIVRWMALKVGGTRATFPDLEPKVSKMAKPVPYMTYDGSEPWPVIAVEAPAQFRALPKNLKPWAVTPLGLYFEPITYVKTDLVVELADDFNAMMTDVQNKLGNPPQGGSERAAWMDRRYRVMLPHCQKKLSTEIKPLKAEMQRLEKLWNEVL